MVGETVGTIIDSKSNLYKVGDNVCIHKGWQTYIKAKDTDLSIYKIPNVNIPLSAYLGVAGMPGRTAYFGFNRVGKPNKEDVVVVSAASGAVGSVVGQLAKIKGCKVIGIAGGSEKCSYVRDQLGFDNCIDYKDEYFIENLNSACNNGIDIYFENVGGPVSMTVASLLNNSARIPVCGFISQYNEDNILESDTPFKIFGKLKPKPFHRFFVVTEWMDEWDSATHQLTEYILNNDIKYKETITKGFENAPQALRDVLTGKNFGKQLIEV
jgi:NADPH-dependent curcumin reductase CurA